LVGDYPHFSHWPGTKKPRRWPHGLTISSSIHGIQPEDVMGKPTMRVAYPALMANLANCVIVHHTHFDKTPMRQAATKYGFPSLDCNWIVIGWIRRGRSSI
jgi:hypothetical protein